MQISFKTPCVTQINFKTHCVTQINFQTLCLMQINFGAEALSDCSPKPGIFCSFWFPIVHFTFQSLSALLLAIFLITTLPRFVFLLFYS